MPAHPRVTYHYALAQWTILLTHPSKKRNPLRIYSINLDQSQTSITSHSNASPSRQQEHSYRLLSLKSHTHSTTSACSSLTISFVRLLQIPIDMRLYRDYAYHKRERENG